MDNHPKLTINGISKKFPGVLALDNVSLEIMAGEVHGVVGENGAGKSTLMHILAGVFPPDTGKILLAGEPIDIQNEKHAQDLGLVMVYQDRSLVNDLSIAENIFVGRQPVGRWHLIDVSRMEAEAGKLLEKVGLDKHPSTLVSSLNTIEQQLVEIAKALSYNPKVLILDEPTATITQIETEILFKLINTLKDKGVSIIYVSHRIKELPQICDRVSILKDGKNQGTCKIGEVSLDDIVRLMVGRKVLHKYLDLKCKGLRKVLEVKGLTSKSFSNISFDLYEQEILGISGLAGAGRTALVLTLFGVNRPTSGQIILFGERVEFGSPTEAMKADLGYLTEDRKHSGLFMELDLPANISSASLSRFTKGLFLDDKEMLRQTRIMIEDLNVVCSSLKQKIVFLSGGNQQKMLIGRWLLRNPRIFIIDEPTIGVDIGAKEEIYKLIRHVARQGTSVILISSELQEIMSLCDRALVMHQGKITGELLQREFTEEQLLRLSAGLSISQ